MPSSSNQKEIDVMLAKLRSMRDSSYGSAGVLKLDKKLELETTTELFRADLISAMKLPDTEASLKLEFIEIGDTMKPNWFKEVQVPKTTSLTKPKIEFDEEIGKLIAEKYNRRSECKKSSWNLALEFDTSTTGEEKSLVDLSVPELEYNLDLLDQHWLKNLREEIEKNANNMNKSSLNFLTASFLEVCIQMLELSCHEHLERALKYEREINLIYDENVICDVCRSPDSEEDNEMVFCDTCNICVHQACFGITKVPQGNWLCNPCSLGNFTARCILCPNKGGALKPTKSKTRWVHVSCALWIPEVGIEDPEKMEPIINISHIPPDRWNLSCFICKEKDGACIQCSFKTCHVPFHVTCGFIKKLHMAANLEEHSDKLPYGSVKLKAFCPKHRKSSLNSSENKVSEYFSSHCVSASNDDELGARLQKIAKQFFLHVNANKVIKDLKDFQHKSFSHLGFSQAFDFIFNYWKLKRASNACHPLIKNIASFLKDENQEPFFGNENCHNNDDSALQGHSDLQQKQWQALMLNQLKICAKLRQDLERLRNLSYLILRREKTKRSKVEMNENMFSFKFKLHSILIDSTKEMMDHVFLNSYQREKLKLVLTHGNKRKPRSKNKVKNHVDTNKISKQDSKNTDANNLSKQDSKNDDAINLSKQDSKNDDAINLSKQDSKNADANLSKENSKKDDANKDLTQDSKNVSDSQNLIPVPPVAVAEMNGVDDENVVKRKRKSSTTSANLQENKTNGVTPKLIFTRSGRQIYHKFLKSETNLLPS